MILKKTPLVIVPRRETYSKGSLIKEEELLDKSLLV